ncbi:transmembrane protein 208-like [Hydractinia symbiolongicarpus]|uniref:transmembrane protein 208-like n=1 Tax=Hydractinia symbiolongicarpus TaxID=13093 RepID=UPI0025518BAB|nr:transmembrane protein 208-like [Hydractinia symbiolongicarpus]
MAPKVLKKGQKQINEENTATLGFYRNIVFAVSVVYVGVTVVFFELHWKSYLAICLSSLIYIACYKFMSHMVQGGMDLTMEGGMAEHAKDLLLVTAIIQTLSLISNYFWLLWLVVPGRGVYMLWVNILSPWFFAEPPPELDEKQQKKMERKMKRQQYSYR